MAKEEETPESAEKPEGETPAEEETSAEQPEVPKQAKDMAMLCHLLGIAGFFAPLVIWLNEKDKHEFVNDHGRGAINYQISVIIYYAVSWLLCFIIIGIFMLIALVIMHVIFVIIGAVKAHNGKSWRYPIAIPFLK